MPAHVLRQAPGLRDIFAERVQDKTAAERDAVGQRIEERLAGSPKPLRSLIRWGVQGMWDSRNRQHARHGRHGERQLTAALRWRLSSDWWLVPDVLVSSDNTHVAQIDLVAVGPSGVMVIEVKRWRGVIRHWGALGAQRRYAMDSM